MAETPVALSIRQPWAELILLGKKTIELRSWNTKRRGTFYVHVSENMGKTEKMIAEYYGLDPKKLVSGAIVGRANLVDVRNYYLAPNVSLDDSDGELADKAASYFLSDSRRHRSNLYIAGSDIIELDVHLMKRHDARFSQYGFILDDIVRFKKPVEYKGKLGFFSVADIRGLDKQ